MPASSSYALAQHHVLRGRTIVARQRRMVAEMREVGRDSAVAEDLLAQFERTLKIFEYDLAALKK
jgi:hypothetical protein